MTELASPPADAVSEVLRSFAVRSEVFCVSELRSPWAFRVAGEPVAKFHLVLEGSALLVCGTAQVWLTAGDLVALPHGTGHTLADAAGSPAPPLERLLAGNANGRRLSYGGDGPLTRLLCGGFALADGIPEPTLALVPNVVHSRGTTPWLAPVLAALAEEAEGGRPGAGAIVAKLADVFLAQALRSWLLDAGQTGLADARLIPDVAIAQALDALNRGTAEPWSLDRLARHVGLSRSALAANFRQRVGLPPMRYLSELRLRGAADQLATGRLPLHEVGRRAGYASDAAFAKAFKRRFGVPPGAYRERAGEPPAIEVAGSGELSAAHAGRRQSVQDRLGQRPCHARDDAFARLVERDDVRRNLDVECS